MGSFTAAVMDMLTAAPGAMAPATGLGAVAPVAAAVPLIKIQRRTSQYRGAKTNFVYWIPVPTPENDTTPLVIAALTVGAVAPVPGPGAAAPVAATLRQNIPVVKLANRTPQPRGETTSLTFWIPVPTQEYDTTPLISALLNAMEEE